MYSSALTLTAGCTVKAVAHLGGSAPSNIVEAVFERLERSGAPVITAPEIFYEEATISVSAASGAKIFYTIDGSDPEVKLLEGVSVGGNLYEAPFGLTSPAIIKAVALEEGKAVSMTTTAEVKQARRTPKPVFDMPAEFEGETEIVIEAFVAKIFYTLGSETQPEVKVSEVDGSISVADGTLEYTAPIVTQSTTVIKAVAVGQGLRVSEVAQGIATKRGQTQAPTISGDNPFVGEAEVVLEAPLTARILYTLDGSNPVWELDADGFATPKDGSTTLKYDRNGTLKITDRTIVKAVAHEKGKTVSELVSITFVPADASQVPRISGRTPFASSTEVTLVADNGARLFYTTDGSDPVIAGNWYNPRLVGQTKEYTAPVVVRETSVVKAVAWEKMLSVSPVVEMEFCKFEKCEIPEIIGATPFETSTEVSITAPDGSEVYYSIDGKEPTASLDDSGVITGGPLHYEGPFKISADAVVKAIAVSAQQLPSDVVFKEFVKLEKTLQPVIAAPDLFGDEAVVEIRIPEGAVVRYTLDGSEPDENSSLYGEALIVANPCEIRARAWKEGCQPSDVAVQVMRQMDCSESVVISGTSPFVHDMTVTMTAAPQAKIYYSTDGVTPIVKVIGADKVEISDNTLLYTEPVRIDADAVFIAVALEGSKRASEPVERAFQRAVVSTKPVIEGITPFLESTIVTITAAQGADIYFTLDGTEPTQSSFHYTEPFRLNYSALVKAIAKQPEHDFSEVAESRFEKEELSKRPVVEAPAIFGDEVHVRIVGTGAVWYTLDGTDPVPGISERYEDELVLTEPFTIKAVAQSEGKLVSETVEHIGRQMDRTAGVTISGNAHFENASEVSLEAGGATIWYTLDGTMPTVRIIDDGEPQVGENCILYTEPFEIESSLTVSAVAVEAGKRASLASQQAFERMDKSSEPSISGTTPFDSQTLVTITAQSGAQIYFTVDGTRPQPSSNSTILYSEPLLLTTTTLVRAIAVEENKAASRVAEMLFERMEVSGKPEIEVSAFFGDEADVVITAASGARIFYTVDGTMPDVSATEYTGPFLIASSAVIRAVALEEGKILSVVAERETTQMERTPDPEIEVEEWNDGSFRVNVTAVAGAEVYYSVGQPAQLTLRNQDDLVVGSSTQVYRQPVKVEAGTSIYVVAFKPYSRPSEIVSAVMPERESALAPVIEGDNLFEETTVVSMTAEDGLRIFYTLDGRDPEVVRGQNDEPVAADTSTKEYYVPFEISESMTVKAIATAAGIAVSPMAVKEFVKSEISGIGYLSDDDESVKVGPGRIYGPVGMKVYDAWGRLCPHEGLRPGVYIVVSGGQRFKVMVKS